MALDSQGLVVLAIITLIVAAFAFAAYDDYNRGKIVELERTVSDLRYRVYQDSLASLCLTSTKFDTMTITVVASRIKSLSYKELSDSLMTKLYGNRWRKLCK